MGEALTYPEYEREPAPPAGAATDDVPVFKCVLQSPISNALATALDLECAMIAVPWEPDEQTARELHISSDERLPIEIAEIVGAESAVLLAGKTVAAEAAEANWFLLPVSSGRGPAGVCLLRGARSKVARDERDREVLSSMLHALEHELETLRSAASAKSRTRQLSVLAGGIAHSVRNPLAGISTVAQLLRGRTGGDASMRRCVDLMLEEADKVEGLMRDFLEYGSCVEPCLLEENAHRILTSSVSDMQAGLSARGIEVALSKANGLPPVKTDAELLGRAIRVIIANSIEGMPQGGRLCTRLSAKREGDRDRPTGVEMLFADTGAGIRPGAESRAFTPFFKVGARRMGLRLAAAEKFVKLLGGAIRARPAQGLELVLTIPAAR